MGLWAKYTLSPLSRFCPSNLSRQQKCHQGACSRGKGSEEEKSLSSPKASKSQHASLLSAASMTHWWSPRTRFRKLFTVLDCHQLPLGTVPFTSQLSPFPLIWPHFADFSLFHSSPLLSLFQPDYGFFFSSHSYTYSINFLLLSFQSGKPKLLSKSLSQNIYIDMVSLSSLGDSMYRQS